MIIKKIKQNQTIQKPLPETSMEQYLINGICYIESIKGEPNYLQSV